MFYGFGTDPEGGISYKAGSWSIQVARAGLAHWSQRAEESLYDFHVMVHRSILDGEPEREFVRRGFGPVSDPRWVRLLYSNVAAAMQDEERRSLTFGTDTRNWHFEVDAVACRLPNHRRLDGAYLLVPQHEPYFPLAPFDWMCRCATIPVPLVADLRWPNKRIRPESQIMRNKELWLLSPPSEKAINDGY